MISSAYDAYVYSENCITIVLSSGKNEAAIWNDKEQVFLFDCRWSKNIAATALNEWGQSTGWNLHNLNKLLIPKILTGFPYARSVCVSNNGYANFNSFYSNIPYLYPLQTSENLSFSDVFRGYRYGILVGNGLSAIHFY